MDLEQQEDGVLIRNAKIKPSKPMYSDQYAPRTIRCPWCGSKKVKAIRVNETHRVYRCGTCVDPDTSRWTTFPVMFRDAVILNHERVSEGREVSGEQGRT